MHGEHSQAQKVRFYTNIAAIYLLTIAFAWYVIHPLSLFAQTRNVSITRASQKPHLPTAPKITLIAGRPVRIVIPNSAVDLPVDPGYYNSADNSWTLSGYHAQFAMVSTLANNSGGDTFVYGHNNNSVFGPLRHVTPISGAEALIYTDNGHIFSYRFKSVVSLTPNDTSVLHYQGPPMLTIQTCTGSINEWRSLFRFSFDKVVQ